MKSLSLKIILIVLGLGLLGAYTVFTQPAKVTHGAVFDATRIGTATTSAAVAVTSSARVLATTTNPIGTPGVTSNTRIYATICNPSSTVVFLNLDGDKAASLAGGNFTVAIAAAAGYDACYEITDRNSYQGSVTASSTNQTAVTVYAKDYTQ